jgi:Ca2+-binding RTX toxin-like protein
MIKGLGTRRALAVVSVTAAAVAASGVLAQPAHAAATGTVKVSGTTVVFSAAPGAANAVTVSGMRRSITVDDRVPIKAGAGCKAVKGDKTKVTCTTKVDVTRIRAVLGDKDDTFANKTSYGSRPATVGGGAGNDTLIGGMVDDLLSGDAGNDRVFGGYGNDTLAGGDGNDTLSDGLRGNDTLSGGAGRDTLSGGWGEDIVMGGEGNDVLNGDEGRDRVQGGADNDVINGGPDSDGLLGEAGNDRLLGGGGADVVDGGIGTDTVSYAYVVRAGAYVSGDFSRTAVEGSTPNDHDFLYRLENFVGTPGNDRVGGDTGPNTIDGGAGNDEIDGDAGNDSLHGGAGADRFRGGTGNDVIHGGAGADLVTADQGDDIAYGQDGDDTLNGEDGDDTLHGGLGADRLSGASGDDQLWTEPTGSVSGSEYADGGLDDTTAPGDTCYVPPTGEHTMISCETVATNQPAALGLRSLDLAALSALLIR